MRGPHYLLISVKRIFLINYEREEPALYFYYLVLLTNLIFDAVDSPYGAEGNIKPSFLSFFFAVANFIKNFYYDEGGSYSFVNGKMCRPIQFGIFWDYIFIFISFLTD